MTAGGDLPDLVAETLFAMGATAVEEQLDRLVAGMPDRASAERAVAVLGRGARTFAAGDDWRDAWRPFARPVRVGPVLIVPSWWGGAVRRRGAGAVVVLDPGRAFGTGDHPSTRLALSFLAALGCRGRRVLDVGSGSGVLAVAAAALGAEVTALDVDPEAVSATRENAVRNGVAVDVIHGGPEAAAGPYDIVVANLGGVAAVVQAADGLRHATAERGALVVSGLLQGQQRPVELALGWPVERVRRSRGWCAVQLRRSHSDAAG